MAKKLEMPKMGYDMVEGTLAKWLKQPGDEVSRGEPIAEVETDKVTIEIEAFEAGKIIKFLVNEGDTVPVGAPIAEIDDGSGDEEAEESAEANASVTPSSDAPAVGEGAEAAPTAPAVAAQPEKVEAAPAESAPAESTGRLVATPVARGLAEQRGVNLAGLKGSGPDGRIVKADVLAAASEPKAAPAAAAAPAVSEPKAAPAAAAAPVASPVPAPVGLVFAPPAPNAVYSEEPLSRLRQTAAKRMVESQQQVPPFFVTSTIEMDAIQELLPKLREAHGGKLSVTELLLKACAIALKKFPSLNATFAGDKLLVHKDVHISVAVATDAGLLAPVVRNCDSLSLGAISSQMRDVIGRTREGKAGLDDLQGGTFTVSNLGMFDVTNFIAIITPPQSAILAVGSTIATPVVRDGEIVIRHLMNLTVSADHRATDGATVAQFLVELKNLLQNPFKLLL
ncbi:dihydrolipoamide acetyltransferase family protein [Herpetosiphon llansteffanensis]|uniref:dihydrolipoamide acetyltransferase family protein n=1 Tax=Herpetosiphon llansteffanensis TaxID=2094568 RepID=UPI000D7C63B1|nr:dihydrolipoamide acetyltransferase family protein [Herpetosiphon llansteffanensis]